MTVIVMGAGLAGLSTASALVEAGREVVVLEARQRVGGRVEGGTIAGHPVELGGTWLGAEYATRWNGYMEGAVLSGEATAAEVLAAG